MSATACKVRAWSRVEGAERGGLKPRPRVVSELTVCSLTGLVKLAVSSGAVSSVLLYCCTAPLLAVASSGQ